MSLLLAASVSAAAAEEVTSSPSDGASLAAAADARTDWHNRIANYVNDHPDDYAAITVASDGSLTVTPSVSAGKRAEIQLEAASDSEARTLAAALQGTGSVIPQLRFKTPQAYSTADLLDAQQRLTTAIGSKAPWTTGIREWGPTLDGGFRVGTVGDISPATKAAIEDVVGVPISLESTKPSQTNASRMADQAPWSGGGRISKAGGGICTAGFGVTRGSSKYLMTAGHCGVATWKNGVGSLTIGGTPYRSYSNNGFDVQLIGPVTSLTGRLWADPYQTGTAVHGLYTIVGGESTMCANGSVTLARCGNQVYATNQCVTFSNGQITCKLAGISNPAMQQISVGGDSGGPVFRQASGYDYGAAIIIGSFSTPQAWVQPLANAALPAVAATLVLS